MSTKDLKLIFLSQITDLPEELVVRAKQKLVMNLVNVYDENEDVICEIEYNAKLDHWDGHNYSCGATGRHLGLEQLEDGRYVLIHGTQWQGESDHAEIISAARAAQEILKSGNTGLFDEYPELAEIRKDLNDVKKRSKSFSIRVSENDTAEEIAKKIADLQQKIAEYFQK